jgi:hypothetical protein
MNLWTVSLCAGVALVGLGCALYALHRLCLWLEARGHLYYWHKQPDGSAAGCMTAFQEVIEPQVKHVLHVREQKRSRATDEGGGPDDASRP